METEGEGELEIGEKEGGREKRERRSAQEKAFNKGRNVVYNTCEKIHISLFPSLNRILILPLISKLEIQHRQYDLPLRTQAKAPGALEMIPSISVYGRCTGTTYGSFG